MTDPQAGWEARLAALWAEVDSRDEADFITAMEALSDELPPGSAVGIYERAAAYDSTGHPELAVPLYSAALDAGLEGGRRRRAVIQMASSVRNLGHPEESLRLLVSEATAPSDHLDGAVATFTALALADLGREREALAVALTVLATTLPRYNRSAERYARALVDPPPREGP